MFEVFLYPVSAVLWFWHQVFGAVFGAASGAAWVLAIAFLVFTARGLLIKPALHQLRSARRTQHLAPQVAAIRKKHRTDRARQATELQKLYAANGVSMFGGIGSMIVQLPVVLSLYGVLRGFTPAASGNRIFDRADVESFLDAHLFGARIGNWISQPTTVLLQAGTDRWQMVAVGVPIILLAGAATFLSLRLSTRRAAALQAEPQLSAITRVMPYLAPLGLLVSGLFFAVPLALLVYFLATNLWTLGQTHFLGRMVDREFATEPPKVKRPTGTRGTTASGR